MSFIKKYWKIIAYIIAGLLVIHIGYTIYNLRKDHRFKAGVAVVNDKAHPVIGYEQGKIEGLVYFNGKKPEGVSVMYNLLEW